MERKKVQNESDANQEITQALGENSPTASEENVADAAAAEFESAEPSIAVLESELAEARSRALRAQAEFENFRKRIRRDMDEERRYANLPLIRDLLPVIDNLDRALAAVQLDGAANGLLEGVQMVAHQLHAVLEQHDCQAIEAIGLSFDPMCHEAIAEQPSDEHPAGSVMEVVQVGYRIHDRVIRPTQVIVSKGPGDASASSE